MRLPEEQRRVIAEFCGWTQIEDRSESIMMPPGCAVVGYPPEGAIIGKKQTLPDYLNDLNAMHEAESKAPKSYWHELAKVTGYGIHSVDYRNYELLAHATASQRAEALLTTLGVRKEPAYATS